MHRSIVLIRCILVCQLRADKPRLPHHPLEMDEGGEWLGDWSDHIFLTHVTYVLTHGIVIEYTLCGQTQTLEST